jgi:hypothetical protein
MVRAHDVAATVRVAGAVAASVATVASVAAGDAGNVSEEGASWHR